MSRGYAKGKAYIEIDLHDLYVALLKTKGIELDDSDEVRIELIDDETASLLIPIVGQVNVTKYPGRMYLDNGDPGYPDDYVIDDLADYHFLDKRLKAAHIKVTSTDYDFDDEIYEDSFDYEFDDSVYDD